MPPLSNMDQTYVLIDSPGGLVTIGLFTVLTNIFHDLYPIITTVGAIAGTFLAVVGAYRIIRGWIKGSSSTDIEDTGYNE